MNVALKELEAAYEKTERHLKKRYGYQNTDAAGEIVSMMIHNLFTHTKQASDSEVFETLLQTEAFKLERVVSTGQATPPGQWYDQDWDEWVVLLSGSAGLLFDGERDIRVLQPGDYLLVPAHTRHRVEWTETGAETVWLTLHYTTWPSLS